MKCAWIVGNGIGLFLLLLSSTATRADETETLDALLRLGIFAYGEGSNNDNASELAWVSDPPEFSDAKLKEAVILLANAPRIRELHLEATPITDAGLEYLAQLKNLRRLHLEVTKIGDVGLKRLEEMPELREIDLSLTRATARGIASLKKALPRAKVIHSDLSPQTGDAAKLQGRWQEIADARTLQKAGPDSLMIVGQDLALYRGPRLVFHSRFTLRPDKNPAEIDLPYSTVLPGFNSRWIGEEGIYKFEAGRLILCSVGGGRPSRFNPKQGRLTRFERAGRSPDR
jgi:uncharacterized protein (TIGR03067 family)